MIISRYRTQWALFFLLFGIQAPCLAPWRWPFFRPKQAAAPRVQNIIFDLGGVLMQTDRLKAGATIGYWTFLYYMIRTFNSPSRIEPAMYKAFDRILPIDPHGPLALTPDGKRLLPQIMRNWLSGAMTCAECKNLALSSIDQHPEYFVNNAEQESVKKVVNMTFSPEKLSSVQVAVPQGIDFIQQCKQRGFNVYILSNLDAESYELLRTKNPRLFELFDEKNIFISGKIGLIKPDLSLFEYVLEQADIDAQNCVFFDDQKENIDAARSCGINAFQCRSHRGTPDYASMKKQLDSLLATQEHLNTLASTAGKAL